MGNHFELICVFLLVLLYQTIPLIVLTPLLAILLEATPFLLFLLKALPPLFSVHFSLRPLEELVIFHGNLPESALDPTPVLTVLKRIAGQLSGKAGIAISTSLEFLVLEMLLYFLEVVSSPQLLVLQSQRLLLLDWPTLGPTEDIAPQGLHKLLDRHKRFQVLHRLQQILEALVMTLRPQLQSLFHFSQVTLNLTTRTLLHHLPNFLMLHREVHKIIETLDQIPNFHIFHFRLQQMRDDQYQKSSFLFQPQLAL